MNNTLIASKCVDRLMGSEDDLQALKDCIELDFLGMKLSSARSFVCANDRSTRSPCCQNSYNCRSTGSTCGEIGEIRGKVQAGTLSLWTYDG